MMGYSNALEYLESKIEDEVNTIVAYLIQGSLDGAEYKLLCGKLQGLELAKNIIKDLAKRLETADE